ncbi:hypothetical protein niasHT_031045 [Heterodera trifolii]|uniref:Uncharacterized protein n=1 Tax=Heterodera trifolii TaxID=157864 RepID=A0ABD2HTZ0_9BILA
MCHKILLFILVISLNIGYGGGWEFLDSIGTFIANTAKSIWDNGHVVVETLGKVVNVVAAMSSVVYVHTMPLGMIMHLVEQIQYPNASNEPFACGAAGASEVLAKELVANSLGCLQMRSNCYSMCGETQKNCDDIFCNCLSRRTQFSECGPMANSFCYSVQWAGKKAFDAAQAESCQANTTTKETVPPMLKTTMTTTAFPHHGTWICELHEIITIKMENASFCQNMHEMDNCCLSFSKCFGNEAGVPCTSIGCPQGGDAMAKCTDKFCACMQNNAKCTPSFTESCENLKLMLMNSSEFDVQLD